MGHIVLSHASALQYWRSAYSRDVGTRRHSEQAAKTILEEASCNAGDIDRLRLASPVFQDLGSPLHLLVGSAAMARRSPRLYLHSHTAPVGADAFALVSHDLYVCSPEFTFVHACLELDFLDAVLLGCELCGRYRRGAGGADLPLEFEPATSRERIAGACEGLATTHGIRGARQAARFVLNGATSSHAAKLAVYLGFSKRYGGEALGRPLLGHSVEVPACLCEAAGRERLRCDLLWPEKKTALILKTEGSRPEAPGVLEDMGMRTLTVDPRRLADEDFLDELVKALKSKSGAEGRRGPEPHHYGLKKAILRHRLFGPARGDMSPRPGLIPGP